MKTTTSKLSKHKLLFERLPEEDAFGKMLKQFRKELNVSRYERRQRLEARRLARREDSRTFYKVKK